MKKKFELVLNWMNSNYKQLLFIMLIVFFFAFPVLILFDSGHYMQYVAIFERKLPFVSWDIVRGPVFPLLIHINNTLFGKSSTGLLFFPFIFYLLMLIFSKKIIDIGLEGKTKLKSIAYVVFVLLVVINPIIYGYYHSLLTEFVAMTVAVVSSFFAWKLLYVLRTGNKKGFIWLSLYFILAFPFSWFLKQPYLSISFFPLLTAVFLSLWELETWKKRLPIILVFILSMLSLATTIFIWNKVLEVKSIERNTNRESANLVGFQLVAALTELNTPISFSKSEIPDEVRVLDDEGNLISSIEIEVNQNRVITTSSGLKFLLKATTKHPKAVLKSYVNNYLAISNIYKFEREETEDDFKFTIIERILPNHCFQNCIIASDILKEKSNIYYMTPELSKLVVDYEQKVNPPPIASFFLGLNKNFSNVVTNYSILLLPVVLMISFVCYIVSIKKKENSYLQKVLSLVVILLSYSFFHLLLHSFIGAIIDRYGSPVHITMFLGYIILILTAFSHKRLKKGM